MLFGVVLEFWDFWWIWVIVVFGLSGLTVYLQPKERGRLRRIEAKLDQLLKQAGIEFDPYASVPPTVLGAVRRGDRLEAIKLYRKATGIPYSEAMEQIDDMMANPPKT